MSLQYAHHKPLFHAFVQNHSMMKILPSPHPRATPPRLLLTICDELRVSLYCIYSNGGVNTEYKTALTIVVLCQSTIMFLFVMIYHLITVFVSMLLVYADV